MIIGVIGFKRSGKDTIADYLVSKYNFKRYGFADPIREALKIVFLWTDEWIDNHKEEIDPRWGLSYRQAAQHFGTEWAQFELQKYFPGYNEKTGRKLWVKRFIEYYNCNPNYPSWVLPDVRFPHEVEELRKLNALFIKVDRGITPTDLHESEIHIPHLPYDFIVSNLKDKNFLYSQIDKILN